MDALISEFNRAIKRGVWKPYCALGVVVNTFAISYGNTLGNKVAAMRLNKLNYSALSFVELDTFDTFVFCLDSVGSYVASHC